ncbi:PREDICTED: dimethylaniline monooxygenase [N-oxide-forming] 5-like [Amphimedon queenslandica]|uniref:Flavin-containing monooxygenase n=1 Tax=Amphimedon queenslandica TaxID=400682 RepID=A0A1X7UZK9_AMPQE|nr:PREDICTED: dimethylaniline monooxygenase [N-oxide-forming] 5-like [Amphimedon queenslandica]|eukprot:XP_003386180.1 PREDICTED: dimethylaniline monooxygenase [N-oxide-forming] 5-like [Amphimedon queenslandica]
MKGKVHDVTVIGAGWSGVTATKYMLEEGLSVVTLERRDHLGGLWYYSDDPSEKSVMKRTRATSSATVSEMSDYPMPESMTEFPHHKQMLQYLRSYASHFGVLPCIVFNTTVTGVSKEGDLWQVTTVNSDVYTSKFLVVCTGQTIPLTGPKETIFKNFSGPVHHAKEIRDLMPEYKNERLLIFGGGETAADICSEWYDHVSVIYWSSPRGQHFFRGYGRVLPFLKPIALDKASSWIVDNISPYHKSKPGFNWICKWTTNGSLLAYQGHGIPEWKNNTPLMHQFVNKNGHVLDLVDYIKVVPKGAITECRGKTVMFADGSSSEFDVVILSTGYTESFPFLPEDKRPRDFLKLHKQIINNDDPTLAFVGFIRPVLFSVFGVVEMQSRWLSKMFSGSVQMKSRADRIKETNSDARFWKEYFKTTVQPRDKTVEFFLYVNGLAKQIGVYPNRSKLFKRSIYGWYVSLAAPLNSSIFRLNDEEHATRALVNLDKHRKGTLALFYFSFFFLRILHFTEILSVLESIKYRIQTSKVGKFCYKVVGQTRIVRLIDWIWCIPKRIFFDNRSKLPAVLPIDM